MVTMLSDALTFAAILQAALQHTAIPASPFMQVERKSFDYSGLD